MIQATQPQSQATSQPHLEYFGGKVLTKPNFVPVYIGKYWKSPRGKADVTYLDLFGKQITQSSYTTIWKEYGSAKGQSTKSDIIGIQNPINFTTADVTRLLKRELALGKVPREDGQTVYSIVLPPGTVLYAPDGSSSKNGLGGYHGSFNSKEYGKVYYSVVAYSDQSNGINFSANPRDNITIVLSHEWTEAVTDPDVNNGRLAWYDRVLGEVSDIPMNLGLSLKQVFGRILGFAVQKNWSNRKRRIVLTS